MCLASVVSCTAPLRPGNGATDGSVMPADAAMPALDAARSRPEVEDVQAPPLGTCRLAAPPTPTFFGGDPASPCPTSRPSDWNVQCDPAQAYAVACIYPSDGDVTRESACQCGEVPRTPPQYRWFCKDVICRREGDACLATWTANPREHEFQLTSSCGERETIACEPAATDQVALDESLKHILTGCGLGYCQSAATLSVFLDGGCVRSFVLAPTEGFIDMSTEGWVVDCVSRKLETVTFGCARNLACGRGELYAVGVCF
jgi:hypothetical protein